MGKIKRWLLDRQQVAWSEPELPKFVKINPLSPPGAAEGIQPGDFSMLKIAEEFLEKDEDFVEAPDGGLALPGPATVSLSTSVDGAGVMRVPAGAS